jgi:hypothetical protein
MFTRASVAKRLKRSIATVRRMEGRELHPWTDNRGVHHFDRDEVEELARAEHLQDSSDEFIPAIDHGPHNARGRDGEQLALEFSAAQDALRIAEQRSAELTNQNQELRTMAVEALELVQVLLGSATPFEVLHCLYDLRKQR